MNYQSMGYVPHVPAAHQSGHGHSGLGEQPMMGGNVDGMQAQMGMGMTGGGIQQHQPPMNHGAGQHLQQQPQPQPQHQGANGYPAIEDDYRYWAPPAPRLSAAAVRAARMEALYPYQALYAGYHQPVHAPVPTPYGAYSQQLQQQQQHQHRQQQHQSQAHHHAQLEHQLMLHHQLSKLHVYPGRSQEAHAHQHAPPPAWEQAQRQGFPSQNTFLQPQQQPPAHQAYDWGYNQGGAIPYQAAPQLQHRQDQQLRSQAHQFSQNQGGWEGYGQPGAGLGAGHIPDQRGAPTQQEWAPSQRGTAAHAPQQPVWQGGFQNGEAHHYQRPVQHGSYVQEPQADAAPHVEPNAKQSADQRAPRSDTGPAPPSPDTLDRSAVPIASLGAEITWAACAALLEPSLLRSCFAASSPSSSKRLSAASSPSTRSPSSLCNSSSLSQSGEWGSASGISSSGQRESQQNNGGGRSRNSSSPNSSASSSEPGTPPSERDGVGAGSLTDAHGLGLAGVPMDGEDELSPMQRSAHKSQGQFLGDSQFSSLQNRGRSHSSRRAATNAATVEKMKSGVHSVLNLISPDWKWSRNDHSLMSLTDHSPLAAQSIQQSSPSSSRRVSRTGSPDYSRRSSSQGNGSMSGSGVLGMVGSPRPSTSTDPNHHPSPSPSAETSPAFKRFVHQVLAQTLLSPTAFLLALLFVVRVPTLVTNSDGSVDPEALQLFAQPPSAAPFKLLTLGVMISNKHLDDNTFLNKTWNEVTGIPLDELNRMERYFLKRCGFEITVPDEVWSSFILRVRRREQQKVAANQQTKRANIQSLKNPALSEARRRSSSELAASEQFSKRLLSALDEMIINLGNLPPIDLSEPCFPIISPVTQDRIEMVNPQRGPVHHHCHSAPPSTLGTEDVFDQEGGPYRPYCARTSTDYSVKPSQGSYYSPPKSAPIPSHEQFGYSLGHGFNDIATLAYRDSIMRGRGLLTELRSS